MSNTIRNGERKGLAHDTGALNLENYASSEKGLSQSWLNRLLTLRSQPNLVVFFLILINLAITLPLAFILNIWFDEAYSLNTSGQGLGYAIYQSIHFEEQAPLYFVFLTLWRSLNSSIFFARLFSILCIALTIYIATLISRTLFKDLHPGWIAAAIALSPTAIWAALEIRLYAFSILLSSLILLLFFRGYLQQQPSRTVRGLYIFLAILALYTHYFLGFLLFANAVALLCLGKTKTLRCYCFDIAVAGFFFLPFCFVLVRQLLYLSDNRTEAIYDVAFPFIRSFKLSFGGIIRYLLPTMRGSISTVWKILQLLLFSTLLSIAFKNYRHINKSSVAVWAITLVTTAEFFLAFELVDAIRFRHTSVIFVLAQLSMFASFTLLQGRTKRKVLFIWLITILFLHAYALTTTYSSFAKPGDYIRVASYVEAHEEPNQPILVFNPEVAMSFETYYNGLNLLAPLPEEEDFRAYDYDELTLESENEIATAIAQVSEEASSLWLIIDTSILEKMVVYHRSYQILERFVDNNYMIAADRDFHGSNVKLLRKKSNSGET